MKGFSSCPPHGRVTAVIGPFTHMKLFHKYCMIEVSWYFLILHPLFDYTVLVKSHRGSFKVRSRKS